MKLLEAIARRLPAPRLTPTRVVLAFIVALATDAVQVALAPLGPVGLLPDEATDVIAMVLICWLLGFHVLLLPTFLIEFVPVVGMLPTWTACVAAVVALRRSAQRREAAPPLIDVTPPKAAPPQLPAPPARRPEPAGPGDSVDANPS